MKKVLAFTLLLVVILSANLSAQYRDQVPYLDNYSGPVVDSKSLTIQHALADFFQNKVRMSHSYSVSFGSYGGSYQNVNAYTNTLEFLFSDRLTGRLDVSFMHSPFGGSNLIDTNNNLGGEVFIRNAELNYKIGKNAHIQLQYQRVPSTFGYYGRYGSPFGFNRFNSWN